MRQIAPELFAPNYADPNAPAHKPPPVAAPSPIATPSPVATPTAAARAPPPPAPPQIVPTRDKPFGACELGAENWLTCLATATALADHSVEDAERTVTASLSGRPGVNPLIADSASRSLRAADDAWRILRDRECADLPLIEAGLDGSLYERRLRCRIRRDVDRVEFLRARYGAAG